MPLASGRRAARWVGMGHCGFFLKGVSFRRTYHFLHMRANCFCMELFPVPGVSLFLVDERSEALVGRS